MRWPYFA